MMKPLKNNRFIQALARKPVDATPIWLMRQAGRYLPEYRELRASAGDFLALCKNPKLACEVTMQPIRRFELDAAILFSDILTIPDAMGLGLHFVKDEGPRFHKKIDSKIAVDELSVPDMRESLSYVYEAIECIQVELAGEVPLIGFSGSPWTLATYMVEGQASKDFRHIKRFLYQEPEAMHQLLDKLAISVTEYLYQQILSGVHAVQIFDTWGGILSTPIYQEFSLNYMSKIIRGLHEKLGQSCVPIIIFTKNGHQWLELMLESSADCVGVDWSISMENVKKRVAGRVAIQGNLDPAILYADNTTIEKAVVELLDQFGEAPGHIFNLGHGMLRDVDPEKVDFLVKTVHKHSQS